ncbi:hypothetical protein IV203_007692 [Nitzschia inconspicua]|uniref:Uncharacterized protein n=1 Tax=Nitzschia inconspicua TaxID=303405 RepID=A0A9K3PNN7_9STRA|nr:hypothetical protein IV203_007692 [Nitzschia inconspicua]
MLPDRLLPLLPLDQCQSSDTNHEEAADDILLLHNRLPFNNLNAHEAYSIRLKRKGKPSIRLRQVQTEVQYNPLRHGHGQARFLAEQQGYDMVTTITTMVSLRRKSHLAMIVMVIVQLASVDTYQLLPIGMVLYAAALQIAWEQWMDEIAEDRFLQHQLAEVQQRNHELQLVIRKAEFEYHVLRNRWDIEIVPVLEPNGRATVYAVPSSKSLRHNSWTLPLATGWNSAACPRQQQHSPTPSAQRAS